MINFYLFANFEVSPQTSAMVMASVNILAPAVTWVAFRFQASAPDQTMSSAAKIFHSEEQILLVIVCQDPFVQSETDD